MIERAGHCALACPPILFSKVEPFVQVFVNGEACEIAAAATVAQLLEQLQIAPRHVAVEVNRELVPRRLHADRALTEGDELEVVTLVGGG